MAKEVVKNKNSNVVKKTTKRIGKVQNGVHKNGKAKKNAKVMNGISDNETAESDCARTILPFHLAFPVHSISKARDFYGRVLGCPEGRSKDIHQQTKNGVMGVADFDMWGHQIVAHKVSDTYRGD